MRRSWGRIIRARWRSLCALSLLGLTSAWAPAAFGASVDQLARAFRESPSLKTRKALADFAAANPTTVDGALANLAIGVVALDDDIPEALRRLSAAERKLPQLADYIGFWIASVHVRAENASAVPGSLSPVWSTNPVSPVEGRAAVVGAKALLKLDQPRAAITLLTKHGEQLPQPQGHLALAKAHEAAGDSLAAVAWYQTVYYGHPLAIEAAEARPALERLEAALGDKYPPAMPKARLDRATKMMEARQYAAARIEFSKLAQELAGAEREIARVRMGACDYLARRTQEALNHLRPLTPASPEAAAERLYYLVAAYRRLDQDEEVQSTLRELAGQYATSPWRLKALTTAANPYLVQNNATLYLPMYTACYESFATTPSGDDCHWRVTWNTWLSRKPEAGDMLREHLLRFPDSDKANAALYFLGRLSEQSKDWAAARRYWEEVRARYPNSYYTLQVRETLKRPEVARAGASPEVEEFLSRVPAPVRIKPDVQPNAVSAKRIERARLLARAALDAWSDGELRFGARHDGQPYVMAMELAELALKRGATPQALRHIKGAANGYLSLPREALPDRFWRMAFPFPYRESIEARAQENHINPYLLAGLIRQESEFDAQVVSYARAVGLTQVMPATGRELARKLKVSGYSTARLKDPATNLRLGSHYLGEILAAFDGRVEPALASYNAGKSRADRWLTWAEYREPAEFIENIPFDQTREYVQVLLRNADMYRTLYEGVPSGADPAPAIAKAPPAPAETAPKTSKTTKTKPPAKPRAKR